MLIVAGTIATDPDLVDDLLADLCAGIASSLAEEGCVAYHFAMEDRAAGHVLTFQAWRDERALALHLARPELGQLVARWQDRFDVRTRIYEGDAVRPVGEWRDPSNRRLVEDSRKSD